MNVDYSKFNTKNIEQSDAAKIETKFYDKNGKEVKKTKKNQNDILAFQDKGIFSVKTDSRRNLVKPDDVEYAAEAEKNAKLSGQAVYQQLVVPFSVYHTYVRYLQDRNNLFYVQAQRSLVSQDGHAKTSTVFSEDDSLLSQFAMNKAKDAKPLK